MFTKDEDRTGGRDVEPLVDHLDRDDHVELAVAIFVENHRVMIPAGLAIHDVDTIATALHLFGEVARTFDGRMICDGAQTFRVSDPGVGHVDMEFICRTEEHTSELQSLMSISYAVFCLKKTMMYTNNHTPLHHNI